MAEPDCHPLKLIKPSFVCRIVRANSERGITPTKDRKNSGMVLMRRWPLLLQRRFIVYTAVVALSATLLIGIIWSPSIEMAVALALVTFLTGIGTWDLLQKRHAVLRNYPLTARICFILEEIRPEIRQYFLESEKDGTPFSRR